jgi:hypothetical protein
LTGDVTEVIEEAKEVIGEVKEVIAEAVGTVSTEQNRRKSLLKQGADL